MTMLYVLIKRNCKLFFRDKGLFLSSLISPAILLLLYITFLGNVYKNSFISFLPDGIDLPEKLLDSLTASQLLSSLLSVCTVTVAFCSNSLMIQDKMTGVRRDFDVTPVKKSLFAVGYYVSTALSTLLICLAAVAVGMVYLAISGWYISIPDILLLIFDVFILTMLGTAISSLVNAFISSQGQSTAVMTIVSACYGFICGAYMPVSSFSKTLQKVLSFFPGVYGTSLLRRHSMQGAFEAMKDSGVPQQIISAIQDSVDYNIYVSDKAVPYYLMILIISGCALLIAIFYIFASIFRRKKDKI